MMILSEHDKELIRLMDTQVEQLIEMKAPDHVIVITLADFIPDVQCIINSTCEKQLDLYCTEYQNFNYFIQIINQDVGKYGMTSIF